MDKATYVRTETLPLGRLRPFPGNAKIGDVPKILESLARNGQYRSLVVREHDGGTLTVLAGNHTLQALAAHGPGDCGMTTGTGDSKRPCAICGNGPWDPVARVEIVTCDDDTATRVNLVDNKTAADGTWDELALASLIEGLGGDVTGTGYTDAELDTLVTALDVTLEDEPDDPYDAEPDDDEPRQPAPAAPATTPAATPGEPAPAPGPTPPAQHTDSAAAAPAGQIHMTLAFTTADHGEATRLVTACRETFPDDDTATLVLRSLRTLVAVLDSRHAPDGVVTVAALTKAAGADR